ncbi:hypothetical protein [Nonomuraea deserti]|uniref:hypothetical protein n=1 Tax=Nonomuraea deserti TaxID=1848322 RepID=UPI001C70A7BF|nr:hypothetical protein [Nonomuraea deserti]
MQEVVADGPLGEGGDGGALALAAGRRQVGELGQERADRRGGQYADFLAVVAKAIRSPRQARRTTVAQLALRR